MHGRRIGARPGLVRRDAGGNQAAADRLEESRLSVWKTHSTEVQGTPSRRVPGRRHFVGSTMDAETAGHVVCGAERHHAKRHTAPRKRPRGRPNRAVATRRDDDIGRNIEQRFRIMMPLYDVDELMASAGHRASKPRNTHSIARRLAVKQHHIHERPVQRCRTEVLAHDLLAPTTCLPACRWGIQESGRGFAPRSDMRILVSNDDGVYSPGIRALAEVAAEFGEVRIVAPDVERSAMSSAITASRPLSYRPTSIGPFTAFRVNGTPADCVAIGVYHWEHVDVVLSGLNIGFNLGNSIWHSGTVAAAKQAALIGVRGIAMSAPAGAEPDFEPFKPWIRRTLLTLLPDASLPLVNVNLPRQPRGLVWSRVSVRRYDGRVVPTTDPSGRDLFWFTVTPIDGAEEGTDRWAVEQGWVALTPLRLDLTDEQELAAVRRRLPLDDETATVVSRPASPEAARSVREDEAAAPVVQTVPVQAAPARDALAGEKPR
jgi:5'-nucleotidase